MPLYSQVTLSQFVTQISSLMDDAESVYWTVPQIQYAICAGHANEGPKPVSIEGTVQPDLKAGGRG